MTITHITEREQALERENERYLKTINIQLVTIEAQQESIISLMDEAALKAQPVQEPVAWCELSIGGKSIAYFDGKPIIMAGKVGNDCHTTPLYAAPVQPAPLTDAEIEAIQLCRSAGRVSVAQVQRIQCVSYNEAQKICQAIVDAGQCDGLELAPSIVKKGGAT